VTNLAMLEARAEEKRQRLNRTLHSLESRATVLGLADDIIARAGGAPRASEIVAALRRNPLLAIGLVVCAGMLVVEVSKSRKNRILNGRARSSAVRRPLTTLDEKESHYGN
jgi:hypothetical protein